MAAPFRFRRFEVDCSRSAQKVTTDSVLLGAWFEALPEARRVLDVGAGMGLLALMAAQRLPQARVEALEIDPQSAADCADNFRRSPWADRLSLTVGDFAHFEAGEPYDLILSNPPYHSETTASPDERRHGARHESGLGVESLILRGAGMLSPRGSIALVCPARQSDRVVFAAEMAGLKAVRRCAVQTVGHRPPSLALFQLARTGQSSGQTLTLRADGSYTADYVALTSDFYLFLH